MSYSNSFPTQRPTLNLDFANSGKLDSRLSYTRSSSGTAFSSEKHLSSENLLPYSNDLSQSAWTKARVTVASTNNTAPDGTATASSVLEDTSTDSHTFYDNFNCVSGQQYSFVFYLKANGRTIASISPQATATIATVQFDLTAVTSTVLSGSADSHSITAIGTTGWYKCAFTVTATATGTGYSQVNLRDASGNSSYTGDVTKGMFAWGASVSSTGQTVVNQTSGSIHREYAPLLKTASADEPRFEYATDGQSVGSGTALGLLVESQVSNLQRYGSAFASWSNSPNTSISSNAAIAPNGLLEADLVVASSTPASTYVYDNGPSIVSGTTYTASTYIKSSGQRYVQLLGGGSAFPSSQYATFDLQTGSVDANGVTASASSVGNGWYRIQATFVANATSTAGIAITFVASATSSYLPTFTGNDYDGLLIWGFQLETGSAASSLANSGTSSSGVTRAADSCSVDLSQINYSGGDTSVIVDIPAGTGNGHLPYLFDLGGSNVEQIAFYKSSFAASSSTNWSANAAGNGLSMSGSSASGTLGLRVSTDNFRADSSNSAAVTDSSITVSPWTSLHLGSTNAGLYQLNGHIKRLSLFNVALSDVELQSLTSS